MFFRRITTVCCLLTLFLVDAFATDFKPGYAAELITDELDSPTSIAVAPDGRIFVGEKGGSIRVVENGQLLEAPLLTLQVEEYGERGLGGILLDPDFDGNGYIYAHYSVPGEEHNRISRFTVSGNLAVPGSEMVLLNLTKMDGTMHSSGRMRWGKDGMLYISTGDGTLAPNAQSFESLLGKMLRIRPDGSIPPDNPFYNTLTDDFRAIYALGLRNPYTFDIDPVSGRIFVNDVGLVSWEEVNEIFAGKNYGWPAVEGYLDQHTPPADYADPVFSYSHAVGCAVVGGLVYNYPMTDYPADIQNHYLFGDFCANLIAMIDLQTNQVVDTFATGLNELSEMMVDPYTGMILYTEVYNGKLWRLRYVGTGAPFISQQPKEVVISAGEDADFSLVAVAVDSVSYQWYRDGQAIPGATDDALHLSGLTASDSGAVFHCLVHNSQGNTVSDSAMLHVTTNRRPEVVIGSPADADRFVAGDTIWFSGLATDPEDGLIAPQHVTWTVDLHHDAHTHPVISEVVVMADSGSFVIPLLGETDTNVWYRITATATDPAGLQGASSVEIFPTLATQTMQTSPSGLDLDLDGSPVETPHTFQALVGSSRVLSAPKWQIRNDSLFRFERWGRRSNETFDLEIPAQPTTYTAFYEYVDQYVIGEGDGLLGAYYLNMDLSGDPFYFQVDEELDLRLEWEAPFQIDSIPILLQFGRDSFSTRWTGSLLAPVTGVYTLYFLYDDRMRLFMGGELLMDHFDEFFGNDSIQVRLEGGVHYPIRIDFAELLWTATMIFEWKPPYLDREIVPQSQLYSRDQYYATPPTVQYIDPITMPPASSGSFVFPVPLEDEMRLYIHDLRPGEENLVTVGIRNVLGQELMSVEVPVDETFSAAVDVSRLPAGQVYLVKLFNGGQVTWLRAVKY